MHLSGNRTNTSTIVAEAVVPVGTARAEEEAVGVVAAARTLRARPVAAPEAMEAEVGAITVANSGQENTAAIGADEAATRDTVLRCPLRLALVE